MKLENQTILITSNEPWGDIWYSKQNYAYELSKKNKVIFINPPTQWKTKNIFSNPSIQQGHYNDNLSFINYENFLPIRSNFLNRMNDKWVAKKIKKWLHQQGITDYIVWAFDPNRLYTPKQLGAKYSIYHCVDYYYFQYLGEAELCKNTDLIFSTSQKFLDEYTQFKKPQYIVPHGISSEEFPIDPKELEATTDMGAEDYGLYVGVIDHRMDFDLLEKALQRFSDTPFVFVGPLRLPDRAAARRIFEEKKYANAHIIGPRHFKTLKYYIKKAKFCISFMDMEYHANIVHHHKTLVYLTQGKPIFGPLFTEYVDMKDILYMDNNGEAQLEMLGNFIQNGEDPSLEAKRIAHAKEHTFESVLARANDIIQQHTSHLD
ncbi:MAG: hypothetical protein MK212_03970 [Saprospiraceae bacterium]|nr:hypothetical protein [Saprospiraceae bacterium]